MANTATLSGCETSAPAGIERRPIARSSRGRLRSGQFTTGRTLPLTSHDVPATFASVRLDQLSKLRTRGPPGAEEP
jgi:hypothetical protein